ncbi:MAG: sensor domain-containing diguanylate cyclase [Gammaproteobacteria bacterium]|nr:sensor domain-containing diguanylate cyclase [Gammaproteobacteria bacterium]
MIEPDTPRDEQARLEALRSLSILDTPPEERFDCLTRLAKRFFDVPIALVSLVDADRQWFKSCVGLGVSETSRDISFCGHAILGDEPFVVPDAIADARFEDNPLVSGEPHIRFYAGCPLSAPNGRKLGTLCVLDRQPRVLDEDDLAVLKDLASMVERELAAVHMATLDELTGISNRRGFIMLVQHSLRICVRQKMSASLVFMDLDKFKAINDTFGHAEGDRALTEFAQQMKHACRDSDVCGRLGGDEFAMLLINTSREDADVIVARLHESVAKYNEAAGRGYDIAFSQGIVGFDPARHPSVDAMLADGDALMYERKRSRR